jgi:acylphosphatase
MTKHFNISIFGQVQGVFFRRTMRHEANRRGIAGFIRNEPDGSVYMEVEGPEEKVTEFIAWLKAGAGEGLHRLTQIDVEEGSYSALEGFEIKE